MENSMANNFLCSISWVTAIVASVTIDLSPFWEFLIKAAPWGSTALLYLINYDKINGAIGKILKKFRLK